MPGCRLADHRTEMREGRQVGGNPAHVFLTNEAGVEKFKDTLQGTHYGGFASQKTMSFEHTERLNAGQYFLVVHDPSLGILSSSSSDITLKAHIAP